MLLYYSWDYFTFYLFLLFIKNEAFQCFYLLNMEVNGACCDMCRKNDKIQNFPLKVTKTPFNSTLIPTSKHACNTPVSFYLSQFF